MFSASFRFSTDSTFLFSATNINEESEAKKYPGQTARICDKTLVPCDKQRISVTNNKAYTLSSIRAFTCFTQALDTGTSPGSLQPSGGIPASFHTSTTFCTLTRKARWQRMMRGQRATVSSACFIVIRSNFRTGFPSPAAAKNHPHIISSASA